MEIITKPSYEHYNKALGKYIRSKHHYNDELKRQGMVPQDKGDYLAERAREKMRKPYKIDKDTEQFLSEVKMSSRNGKVKLSGRQLEFMEKKGVNFKKPEYKGLKRGF